MNAIVESKIGYAQVGMATDSRGGSLMPANFGEVVAFAKVMSRGGLALPRHLRENDGACMAVTMQALRWEMDPFAVANKTYSVNDRLAYEAQLVAAVVHTRAPIKGRPNYTYTGKGPTRRCIVTCEMLEGGTCEYETPEFGQITTKHSPLWKSDPDQQLGYFAIRSWARRYTPEVILGVYAREELIEAEPIRDVTPKGTGLAARLTAQGGRQAEGFNSHHAEPIDAKEIDVILEGDAIPSFGPEPEAEAVAAEFSDVASPEPAQATPSLAERVEAFRARFGAATTTVKLKAIWAASAALRSDLDARDPETLSELEDEFNAAFVAMENTEKEANA